MRHLGKIWLGFLFLAIVVLSLSLWRYGQTHADIAQITYLKSQAAQKLKCGTVYLVDSLDFNRNGYPDFVFSCDNQNRSLPVKSLIFLEARRKNVEVLFSFVEGKLKDGKENILIAGAKHGMFIQWDRRKPILLCGLADSVGNFASDEIEFVWSQWSQTLQPLSE
ncbi:MAG: hypothetical protein ACUVRD_00135 [Bacteroidia bacterium]